MRGLWRVMFAMLLVGVPALWMPTLNVDAATGLAAREAAVQGPASDNDSERDRLCNSDNPRKQKKCHYNGWDNDNKFYGYRGEGTTVNAVSATGLSVSLWRSIDAPHKGELVTLTVTGDTAPIERVSWWATGPTNGDTRSDDLALAGVQYYDCVGAVPCSFSWNVTARQTGDYTVYAKVRDTSGNEVEISSPFRAD